MVGSLVRITLGKIHGGISALELVAKTGRPRKAIIYEMNQVGLGEIFAIESADEVM